MELLTTEFCFRARSVSIDGKTIYDRYFYADVSRINTEHVLYHSNKEKNRISSESMRANPTGFISDAVEILIARQFGTTGLYDPFSCEYCKKPYAPKTKEIHGGFGVRLFEISKKDYDRISY